MQGEQSFQKQGGGGGQREFSEPSPTAQSLSEIPLSQTSQGLTQFHHYFRDEVTFIEYLLSAKHYAR